VHRAGSETASRDLRSGEGLIPGYERSKRTTHQAEYDRLVALRMKAGPSNPQQGFVGADRSKVQRKSSGLLEQFAGRQL
jgi:hypothetical protein